MFERFILLIVKARHELSGLDRLLKKSSHVIARSKTSHLSLRGTKSRSNLIGSGQAPQSLTH